MTGQNKKPKTLNQIKKELRQIKAPEIFKMNNGEKTFLRIVYKNRTDLFEFVSSAKYSDIAKEQESKYDRYDEMELLKRSGYRKIHYKSKGD